MLRFKPYLAFRSVNELTHENCSANTSFTEVPQGISMCLYNGYPSLFMQFSKNNTYAHNPQWYKNIEYYKEQERGYEYQEDLLVPGSFEMPMKKGDVLIFSAGISETQPRKLAALWEKELARRQPRLDMFNTLKNSAQQFYKRLPDERTYLLAGYPWFKARARDQFISLPGCTFVIDRMDYFELIMKTSLAEIKMFLNGEREKTKLQELDAPDALLWFVWTVQQYAAYAGLDAAARFAETVSEIIAFIRKQNHPKLILHNSGMLYVDGTKTPATWMNAVENGYPITPRTGYVVEINALWYNALKFAAEIQRYVENEHAADLLDYQAEMTREAFVQTFWNGTYLYDFVDGAYKNYELRPNMIYAVALDFSPLDKKQQKAVLDITTKELLTPKGLRSLSPKSGSYRPNYAGGMLERNRNYHNGPAWAFTFGAFSMAYLKVYKESGKSFIERMLIGFEAEMTELCVGTLPELFDGNPPFKGHGGMSFAMSVAEVLRVIKAITRE